MPTSFEELVFSIIATDKNASAAFDRFRQKVDQTSRSVDENSKSLDKNAKSIDNVGASAAKATPLLSGLGGVSGMGALIGAGVALAPVLATVGTGLAGFGLAAVGAAKPVLDAAQKTGGLAANMAKLDPEQRKLAQSILGLGQQYHQFEKQLQPEVLGVFNKGIQLAGHLMHDIQPVAKATGIALDTFLSRVDAEFQSGTWQKFFTWMAANAGPDIRLLADSFINLLKALPQVLKDLQPIATAILIITNAISQVVGPIAKFVDLAEKSNRAQLSAAASLDKWTVKVTNSVPGFKAINDSISADRDALLRIVGVAPPAADGIKKAGDNAKSAALHIQSMATAVSDLTSAMSKSIGPNSTFNQDLIATANAGKQSTDALKASGDKIGTHTQKERDAFSANQGYIDQLVKLATDAGTNATKQQQATDAIKRALPQLQNVKGGTREYWQEVRTLIGYLDKVRLEKTITKLISVNADGTWHIAPSKSLGLPGGTAGGPFGARGAYIRQGTTPTADDVVARVSKGELIVPTRMVNAGAVDHLRGQIPGFAAGGLIGSYSGRVAGLPPWINSNLTATTNILTSEIASMMGHAFGAAASAAIRSFRGGGAIGGSAAQNRTIAMRMFPWSASEWPSFDYVEMREAGYSLTAQNPSSGAYGMAQFINGPSEYYQWGGNPNTAGGQLTGMFNYIRSRYGTPSAAAAHEAAFNWYDHSGWLPPGLSMAYNGTGRPERVGGGGGDVYITINVPPTVNPREAGRQVADLLKAHVKSGGTVFPAGVTPR